VYVDAIGVEWNQGDKVSGFSYIEVFCERD